MAHELVTLESPDGRRYRTDSPTEINMLMGSKGYRRVDDESNSGSSKRSAAKKPAPTPEPSAEPAGDESQNS